MKIPIRFFGMIIIFFLVEINFVSTQTIAIEDCVLKESVKLTIDRNVFVIGEHVNISAIVLLDNKLNEKSLSSVLYVELYNKSNKLFAEQKIVLKNNVCDSQVLIPEDCPSGNYNIRAYTQYMKNGKVNNFTVLPIFIINPNVPLPIPNIEDSIFNDLEFNVITDLLKDSRDSNLSMVLNKTSFGPREKVEIELNSMASIGQDDIVNIAVVKKGTIIEKITTNNLNSSNNLNMDTDWSALYLPEISDLTISGKLVYKSTQTPISDQVVMVSLMGLNPQIHFGVTRNDGFFDVLLNQVEGVYKIGVALKNNHADAEILINNNFSSKFPRDYNNSLFLDSTHMGLINELILNQQISSNYHEQLSDLDTTQLDFNLMNPDYIRIMADYIQLNSLEEFFFELLPLVKVSHDDGQTHLAVYGNDFKIRDKNPIVLLDYLPMTDINELMKINMTDIAKISLFNEYYILGDYGIRSLISITTKTNDFARVKLPNNIVFFDFSTIEKVPKNNNLNLVEDKLASSLPFFNTVLFWAPNIILSGTKTFTFYTSDHISNYDIIISGMKYDGSNISLKSSINVMN